MHYCSAVSTRGREFNSNDTAPPFPYSHRRGGGFGFCGSEFGGKARPSSPLNALGLGARRGVGHPPANSRKRNAFLFCRRAGNAVQWIKNGCFAGARELRSGRTKEQKLLSAVEITIYLQPPWELATRYMTGIGGSSCRSTASVPKKRKGGSSSK